MTNGASTTGDVFVDKARVILGDLQHFGSLRVGTSTRVQINDAVQKTILHLSTLTTLQWDRRSEVRALIEKVEYQLEAGRKPTSGSAPHIAFPWLRASTTLGVRLASLYRGGPTQPPGTRPESTEAYNVRIGDYYQARPGVFAPVTNMTTPRTGYKILRLSNGRTAVVTGTVEVWRPVEYALQHDSAPVW